MGFDTDSSSKIYAEVKELRNARSLQRLAAAMHDLIENRFFYMLAAKGHHNEASKDVALQRPKSICPRACVSCSVPKGLTSVAMVGSL